MGIIGYVTILIARGGSVSARVRQRPGYHPIFMGGARHRDTTTDRPRGRMCSVVMGG